jgi:hypothetical protein
MPSNLTTDDLKRLAEEIAADALAKLESALGLGPSSKPSQRPAGAARVATGGGAFDCTGKAFTCGDYTCTGVVGCSGEFGCTIKFAG